MILNTKVRKEFKWREPTKRTHRAVIRAIKMSFKLFIKIVTGKERVAGIKLVVIFAMAALNLSVMARSIGTDKFMFYAQRGSGLLKHCRLVF